MSAYSQMYMTQYQRMFQQSDSCLINTWGKKLSCASRLYSTVVYHECLITCLHALIMATQMDTVHLPALVIMDKNVTS